MPRSIRRALVLLVSAATLCLVQATPARADLSPRCGSGVYLAPGVTVQACVSADLSYVRGDVRVLVNTQGVAFLAPDPYVEVFSYISYGANASEPGNFTGPHRCVLEVRSPGTYRCPAYAARNADGLVYQANGYANGNNAYSGYAVSPWVNP